MTTFRSPRLTPAVPLAALAALISFSEAQTARRPEVLPEDEEAPEVRRPEVLPEDGKPPKQNPRTGPARPAQPPAAPAGPREEWDDLFQLGLTHFNNRNFDLAIRQFEEYTRIAAKGRFADEARFRIAEIHYTRKSWDQAIAGYDIYLADFPAGKNRAAALYHAAESHREVAMQSTRSLDERGTHQLASFDAYRAVLKTTKTGTWACFAAFRLASAAYNEGVRSNDNSKYGEAIPLFTTAATLAAVPGTLTDKQAADVRLGSLYWRGKCQRLTGKKKDAGISFEEVVKVREANKYREDALKELAAMDIDAGRTEQAHARFEALARETADAETKADALVNAGMLDADKGRDAEASSRFEEALKVVGARGAHARARYGLIFSAAKKKDTKRVLTLWRDVGEYGTLDESSRARLLMIVGQAFMDEQDFNQAARIFESVEQGSPDRPEALDAGYKRLVCLFKVNDPQVTEAVDSFVAVWREKKKETPLIDRALLAKAAYYFNRSAWEAAAKVYAGIRLDKLDPDKAATCLYERGWAEAEAGSKEAISTLTRFLDKHRSDPRAPNAIFQRGRACMKADDLTNALRDFDAVRALPVPSEPAQAITWENAIFLTGRIRGSRQEWPAMIKEFEQLLDKFPKTSYAAEANYWIGAGRYQLEKYKESLEPLRKARELDPKAWSEEAGLRIIGAAASIKDVDACAAEVEAYERLGAKKKVPDQILEWVAVTVFKDRKDYRNAARFLFPVMKWDEPKANDPDLWSVMGESLLRVGRNDEAVKAFDNQLTIDTRKPNRARAFLMRGEAFMALNRPEDTIASAQAGLELDAETLNSARLRILWADAALSAGRAQEALSLLNPVPETWKDAEITPLAMWKMTRILEKLAEPEKKKLLSDLKARLARDYPSWKSPSAVVPPP